MSSSEHVTVGGSSGISWYLTLMSRKFAINSLNENSEQKEMAMNESENTEAQFACNTPSNLPNETLFHAVYIPLKHRDLTDGEGDILHVYQEMQAALKIIKMYKKGRLKTFKNRSDAIAYAKTGYEQFPDNQPMVIPTIVTQEKCNFKAPKTQEFIAFKRLIEDGDLEKVDNIVWKNPRFLISDGDTPVILQMGYRYNALHIAAKNDKPQICEFILNTVGDPRFIQYHFGENECRTYLDPAQIMQDLYLNTPDKGLNETPLHFAVKFGFKDVVRVLVSYSQCIKTLRNKYNKLPIDLICSRKCQEDEELKREIRMLLEDQFYVPVLRAEGNACPPIIGQPFSPTSPLNFNRDPISPRLEVRAFAGPMSKSQATEFRRKWKTPPRHTPKKGQGDAPSIMNSPSVALRLQDTEKGLERVGRDLAEEYQVPWKEYWPFLEDFVDFRSDEGLMKLEKYFEKNFNERILQCLYDQLSSLATKWNIKDETEDDTDSLEFFTPTSSPEPIQDDSDDDNMENAEEEGPLTFIEGSSPTKLDHAVYNALSSVICPDTFPYVYRWRHEMQLAMKRDPHRFNDKMKSLRRKLFTNKYMTTKSHADKLDCQILD